MKKYRCQISILLLTVYSISIASCAAKVPMMSVKSDIEGKHFKPPGGKANLYTVRPGSLLSSGVLLEVIVDGKVQGALASGTYLLSELTPGGHTVSVIAEEGSGSVILSTEDGNNYFVKIKPKWGWLAGRVSVENISEETGRNLVQKAKRAESFSR